MKSSAPCLVVMLAGLLLLLGAGVSVASSPRLNELQPGTPWRAKPPKGVVRGVTWTLVVRPARGGHAV